MPAEAQVGRVGVLWRGNPAEPPPATEDNRLRRIFEELEAAGLAAVPIVFAEEVADDVRRTFATLDGVLVWVDPIVRGRDRSVLDAMLRDAAAGGLYVSAHPHVIFKMGKKDVLVKTRGMAWGSDAHLVPSLDDLRNELPARLRSGVRVLKQYHGSQGNGVWRVESLPGAEVRVQHAARGGRVEELPLEEFVERCRPYFEGDGCMIDQPFAARIGEGMIRAYLVHDRVVGFGHQFVTALLPPPEGSVESLPPPPRYYFGPDKAEFQALKGRLESGWVAEMQRLCDVGADELPAVWDADFLLGPRTSSGDDSYMLCEINVSGVFPLPEEAFAPLAEATRAKVLAARAKRRG